MQLLAFILNVPWTLGGIILAIFSLPKSVTISRKPLAIIFKVRSFWWYQWLPGHAKVRALVNGHCIQLGPRADTADLTHELIHVEQYLKEPLIHPLLYILQSLRHGYRANKYEVEAYRKSGSRYES